MLRIERVERVLRETVFCCGFYSCFGFCDFVRAQIYNLFTKGKVRLLLIKELLLRYTMNELALGNH